MFSLKKKGKKPSPSLPPIQEKVSEPAGPMKSLPSIPKELRLAPEVPKQALPTTAPMFVSMNKYHELKVDVAYLKQSASHMRAIINSLKQNRSTGAELLRQTMDQLQFIEQKIDEIKGVVKT